MATTRIMPLHIGKGRTESRAISEIIDYVANPQKTDHGRLITGYGCDTYSDSRMILPIILFGKYFEQNGRMLLPFSISINHATADGYHSSLFLNTIQKNCDEFAGE